MSDRALIVFVKNLIPGKVKTRLAADIGDTAALDVYRKLLAHTHTVTGRVDADVCIYYNAFIPETDAWSSDTCQKRVQTGDDLGERMHRAMADQSPSHREIVLIGSDCPDLSATIIHRAFEALLHVDVVIGPAGDGGYYLIGMRAPQQFLFTDIPWSSSLVFHITQNRLIDGMLNFCVLPVLYDIDTASDLYRSGLHTGIGI